MSETNPSAAFWNYLLELAEMMEKLEGADAKTTVLAQLETLVEAFGDQADPVENFEQFVVVRLAQAVHKVMSQTYKSDPVPLIFGSQ